MTLTKLYHFSQSAILCLDLLVLRRGEGDRLGGNSSNIPDSLSGTAMWWFFGYPVCLTKLKLSFVKIPCQAPRSLVGFAKISRGAGWRFRIGDLKTQLLTPDYHKPSPSNLVKSKADKMIWIFAHPMTSVKNGSHTQRSYNLWNPRW